MEISFFSQPDRPENENAKLQLQIQYEFLRQCQKRFNVALYSLIASNVFIFLCISLCVFQKTTEATVSTVIAVLANLNSSQVFKETKDELLDAIAKLDELDDED
ncbi:MAG: hypothetical protein AAGA60_04645 [Cyanobacteria bacterium P01_E01_bin.42]